MQRMIYRDERDCALTYALKTAPGTRVVGVVGLAHLTGIRNNWNQEPFSRPNHIFEEPPRNMVPQTIGLALFLSLPLCRRIKNSIRRRTVCWLSIASSSAILSNTGRFSFFD